MVAPPVRCEGEDAPAHPAPELGEHTEALLRELGYDSARIKALKNSKGGVSPASVTRCMTRLNP